MNKTNDHAEPTKVETLKNKNKKTFNLWDVALYICLQKHLSIPNFL